MCSKTRGPAISPDFVTCPLCLNKNKSKGSYIQTKIMKKRSNKMRYDNIRKIIRRICLVAFKPLPIDIAKKNKKNKEKF